MPLSILRLYIVLVQVGCACDSIVLCSGAEFCCTVHLMGIQPVLWCAVLSIEALLVRALGWCFDVPRISAMLCMWLCCVMHLSCDVLYRALALCCVVRLACGRLCYMLWMHTDVLSQFHAFELRCDVSCVFAVLRRAIGLCCAVLCVGSAQWCAFICAVPRGGVWRGACARIHCTLSMRFESWCYGVFSCIGLLE